MFWFVLILLAILPAAKAILANMSKEINIKSKPKI